MMPNPIAATVRKLGLFAAAVAALACAAPAAAADSPLQQAIARGRDHFLHDTFGGAGRVCNSCHLGGGAQPGRRPDGVAMPSLTNAAAVFPRLAEDGQTVITLSDQVRRCVAGAVKGDPPAFGSDALNTLVLYVSSLSQGKAVDLGAEPK